MFKSVGDYPPFFVIYLRKWLYLSIYVFYTTFNIVLFSMSFGKVTSYKS